METNNKTPAEELLQLINAAEFTSPSLGSVGPLKLWELAEENNFSREQGVWRGTITMLCRLLCGHVEGWVSSVCNEARLFNAEYSVEVTIGNLLKRLEGMFPGRIQHRSTPSTKHWQIRAPEPAQGRILTCVYCGHEYPQETPASGHQVLTEHIKVCEKHPMRQLEQDLAKANDQLRISKDAVSHTLRAICDDVQKFWLMGGRFSGSFSKLAEAHAALHGLDVETVYQNFKPHDMLAYETYCDEREYNEKLLTHCREKGIKVDFDPED